MQQNPNVPSVRTVLSVTDETPTVRTLEFADDILASSRPGQFAMVWVPRIGELPMSVMVSETRGNAAFTVRVHGATSTGLYNTPVGGAIGVRGPYGNSFDIRRGRALLVGGGTGLVPLMRLISQAPDDLEITLLMGARTSDEVFFGQRAARMRPDRLDVVVTTDDGTLGVAGNVADEAARRLGDGGFDAVYTCGPELMMRRVVDEARSRGVFVQASIERVMKCGLGICGSCCMDSHLVCTDGTVFDGDHLAKSGDFGYAYRSKSGKSTPY